MKTLLLITSLFLVLWISELNAQQKTVTETNMYGEKVIINADLDIYLGKYRFNEVTMPDGTVKKVLPDIEIIKEDDTYYMISEEGHRFKLKGISPLKFNNLEFKQNPNFHMALYAVENDTYFIYIPEKKSSHFIYKKGGFFTNQDFGYTLTKIEK